MQWVESWYNKPNGERGRQTQPQQQPSQQDFDALGKAKGKGGLFDKGKSKKGGWPGYGNFTPSSPKGYKCKPKGYKGDNTKDKEQGGKQRE